MKIIPKYFFNDKKEYKGELFVADLLKKINLSKLDYLLHSQNITGGNKQIWSEIDFVVISHRAILGIEVKSGPVKSIDGIYHVFEDHACRRSKYIKYKSPFVQAKDGLLHLRGQWLKTNWPKDCPPINKVPFVSIAILAKNKRKITDFPEMQDEYCIYEEDLIHCDLLKEKINLAIDFFIEKNLPRVAAQLNEKNINDIKDILRPEIDKSPVDTGSQINQINYLQCSLTEEQYDVIDHYSDQKRLLIDGGAGTGKTFLLLYLLKGEAEKFERLAIISKAKRLLEFIKSKTSQLDNIDFLTAESLHIENREKQYDAIYIDEAQDFCNTEDFLLLDGALSSGVNNGFWRLFGDFENQFVIRDDFDGGVLDELKSLTQYNNYVKLHHNVRNTPKIVQTLELFSKARVGVTKKKGAGPEPECIDSDQLHDILCRNILEIKDFSQVTILYHENCLKNDGSIEHLNCHQLLIGKNVTFSSFEEFKGMESNYVFILGLDRSFDLQNFRDNFYKSVSRARVYCFYLGGKIVDNFLMKSLNEQ